MAKKLESIRIEVAQNGYSLTCGYREEAPRKGQSSYIPSDPPEVFTSEDTLIAAVKKELKESKTRQAPLDLSKTRK